jgi:hypothetical protein
MRWVIAAAAVLVVVLVGTQLLMPPIIEKQVEDRLTKQGGSAHASVSAFPALRLFFHDGDKLDVRAEEVRIPTANLQSAGFKDLDKFDEVDLELTNSIVGPFTASLVTIERPEGESLYTFAFRGTTTVNQLSDFALATLPPALTALVGGLVDRTSRVGEGHIPVRLDATLRSEDGTAQLVRGRGTVAGIPMGPLAVSIAGAIVSRITG